MEVFDTSFILHASMECMFFEWEGSSVYCFCLITVWQDGRQKVLIDIA